MTLKVNQELRALKAWSVLTKFSASRKTTTYKELGDRINIHHRAVRFVLGPMQKYCMENGLPPLTILVLNKNSQLPGDGFIAYDIEHSQDGIEKVFDCDWHSIENPFLYAQEGTTEHELIEQLIKSPQASQEIYALVKVRGIAQRIFRSALLEIYDCSCAICGISFQEVLQGSHIISYSQSDHTQRLDPRNGLLLCSNHHKLFDSGYITITDNYTIEISNNDQDEKTFSEFDIVTLTNFQGKSIRLPITEKHYPNKQYLRQHRENG